MKLTRVPATFKDCPVNSQMLEKINVIYRPRSVRIGKTVPSVLSTALGLRPRAVLKTTGTVFPYTDLPTGK